MRGLAKLRDLYISIHAAREGGDRIVRFKVCVTVISIHAAREGGDRKRRRHMSEDNSFQSTPPVKAATFK